MRTQKIFNHRFNATYVISCQVELKLPQIFGVPVRAEKFLEQYIILLTDEIIDPGTSKIGGDGQDHTERLLENDSVILIDSHVDAIFIC